MRPHALWIGCFITLCYLPFTWLDARELEPPPWSIGDWWVLKSQIYDSGKVIDRASQPGWLPAQSWHFHVETRENIENQPYFVVIIRPLEGNPCPYWFRCWFRASDRYVARYELYHPAPSSKSSRRSLGTPAVRKNFDPAHTLPFVTTTFPALPLTVPVFTDVVESASLASQHSTISSAPSEYASPEFDITQTVQTTGARAIAEEAESPDMIRSLTAEEVLVVTLRTTDSLIETQYWDPQLPWCVYGKRVEHDRVSRRYWLVEMGQK